MVRKIKFAMWNGSLVYRESGKLVPNQSQYTIKTSASGRQTVYKNGVYVGRIGKGTKTQQKKAAEIGSRRHKPTQVPKVERQARRFGKGREYEIESYEKTIQLKEAIAKQPTNRVPVAIKSTINFANVLNDAVHAGFMSEEEALRRFTEYKKATTDEERSRLWDSLHEYNELQGYEESN